MPVQIRDLKVYGSANMPDNDAGTDIGGAVDVSIGIVMHDMVSNGNVEIVSSAAGDTTQTVTVHGRDAGGALINEVKTLSGTTPVPMTSETTWERLLKAIKSATCAGDVAVMAVTNTHTGTLDGSTPDGTSGTVQLASGASGVDDAYVNEVFRTTGGTGANQIARIVGYNGTTKIATLSKDLGSAVSTDTTYEVSVGMVFEKTPNEMLEIRRPFYNAAADAPGGSARDYYEKVFMSNEHATLALTGATIAEQSDPGSNITFALESSLDGNDTNGTGNDRQTVGDLSGYTFDSNTKNVANSQNHTAGAAQGIWLKLSLAAGAAAANNTYVLRENGTTV